MMAAGAPLLDCVAFLFQRAGKVEGRRRQRVQFEHHVAPPLAHERITYLFIARTRCWIA